MTTPARCYVGIDNGISGAWAVLDAAGGVLKLAPLPVKTVGKMTTLDPMLFRTELAEAVQGYSPHILIEPAQMFSPGKKALTSTWCCYGGLLAVIELAGYAWEPVSPQRWQKAMFADHVREVDQKEDGRQRKKSASVFVAQRLFPQQSLSRTAKSKIADNNLADAVLIAEYGRRHR